MATEDVEDHLIPDISVQVAALNSQMQSAAEMALMEMVRFDASNPDLKQLLILAEAASSAAIDGIRSSAGEIITGALAPAAAGPDTRKVLATALAVTRTDRGQPLLSVPGIVELHRTITGTTQDAGAELPRLAAFISRADMPILMHTAVAYAHFTAAPLFTDANGRTGRALVLAMLRAACITGTSGIPLSAGLAGNPRGYADAVASYRYGDCAPIVELFTEASFVTLDNCLMMADAVRHASEEHRSLLGRTRSPAALRITADLARTPALTASTAMAISGASESSAYRALDQLTEAGILAPAPKASGTLAWTAPRIVDALDAFLTRALH